MVGIIILLLIIGLFLWLLGYLFYKSVLWVFKPLVKDFQDIETQDFAVVEEEETEESEESEEGIDVPRKSKKRRGK